MIVIEERKICRMLEGLFQFDKECEWNDAIEEAMHRFVNLPTIEAEPVRHGRWIPQDHNKSNGFVTTSIYYFPKCSECGHSGESTFAFCPHCGARMDGERRTDADNRC